MSFWVEGTIEIDLHDLWEWVNQNYSPFSDPSGANNVYGVPRVNVSNNTMEIDFAACPENHPGSWSEKPKAVTQWETLVESNQ